MDFSFSYACIFPWCDNNTLNDFGFWSRSFLYSQAYAHVLFWISLYNQYLALHKLVFYLSLNHCYFHKPRAEGNCKLLQSGAASCDKNFPYTINQSQWHAHQNNQTYQAAPASFVIHFVVQGLFRISYPAHTSRRFES